MSYSDAINYLYGLQKYGIKLGIEKTEKILSVLGSPQKDFFSVHIAGTNGKGSVSAMVSSILMAHGFKVGLFTSPHLVSFTERIRINNRQISEQDVVNLTGEIKFKIQSSKSKIQEPTFFEFVTAMAFIYFIRNNVDWAVIETGMGGRLDATNTITPLVSVITKIGYDHREFLGGTLTDIAKEKAGIIKKGVPVVCAAQEKEAENVIVSAAENNSSMLYMYGKNFDGVLKSSGLDGTAFSYRNGAQAIGDLYTPLAGGHQLSNACLAIKASMIALENSNKLTNDGELDGSLLKKGLAATIWRGRLEPVSDNPPIIIDGAHNPDAANALSGFINEHLNDRKIVLVIGIMSDKDIDGILTPLLPLACRIIFTAPAYERAAPPHKLAEFALSKGFADIHTAPTVKAAIETAIKSSKELSAIKELKIQDSKFKNSPLILITGSFYTIGEAMEILGERAVLGNLRETL